MRPVIQVLILLAAFVLVTLAALALGAPGIGYAAGFGQIGFAAALILLIART